MAKPIDWTKMQDWELAMKAREAFKMLGECEGNPGHPRFAQRLFWAAQARGELLRRNLVLA